MGSIPSGGLSWEYSRFKHCTPATNFDLDNRAGLRRRSGDVSAGRASKSDIGQEILVRASRQMYRRHGLLTADRKTLRLSAFLVSYADSVLWRNSQRRKCLHLLIVRGLGPG